MDAHCGYLSKAGVLVVQLASRKQITYGISHSTTSFFEAPLNIILHAFLYWPTAEGALYLHSRYKRERRACATNRNNTIARTTHKV